MPIEAVRIPSSWRDPSGFIFKREGTIYRQVNTSYKEHYELLNSSGLYKGLVEANLLLPHQEVNDVPMLSSDGYKIIKPIQLYCISYPYEWCFSQLKAAAVTTLQIQQTALQYGLTLKDASTYNIQFHNGKPIFIDSLSFERYQEGKPWIAYKQFCEHFLAPLALMSMRDVRLGQLLRTNLDGIPLNMASVLLPKYSWLRPSLFMHLHVHARFQRTYQGKPGVSNRSISKVSQVALLNNLLSAIRSLKLRLRRSTWSDYYANTNYSSKAFAAKLSIIGEFIEQTQPRLVWDLGASTGECARIATGRDITTVAWDGDHYAVEKNYLKSRRRGDHHMTPLVLDLTNPSPAIGWANQERMSLMQRGPVDLVMALALVHHLAITNNVPLDNIARLLNKLGKFLIIEFIPKGDSNVQRLLSSRQDIFKDYTKQSFEAAFA